MFKRYSIITVLYILCIMAPLIPGYQALIRLFPNRHAASGILYTLIFFVTLCLVLLLLLPERGWRAENRLPIEQTILWAICGLLIIFPLQMIAAWINVAIIGEPAQSQHTTEIVQLSHYSPIFILTVGIIGPILEEIVFRKIFFGSLRRRMGFILAAVISSLVFALFHFDIQHVLVYFCIGYFLCYVYQKTGRIWANMFIHAGMNTIVLLANLYTNAGLIHFLPGWHL